MTEDVDFRRLFEQAPVSMLVLSPTLEIVAATDAYLADTMTTRDDIVGRAMFDVFPDNPDDEGATGVATLRASLERVLEERVPDTMAVQKYDIRRPDAEGGGFEERHWTPVNTPVLRDDGSVQLIIHQVTDVTDLALTRSASEGRLVNMEQEVIRTSQDLQRANAALRQSEERFRRLTQATTDAVWDHDAVTNELWLSEGYEALLGYPPEVLPTLESVRALIHPDDRDRVLAHMDHAIESGADGWEVEFRILHRRGHAVWVAARGAVLRDDAGRPVRTVGGLADLTVRKEAELRIRQQAALLDQASDAIIVRDLDDRVQFWSRGAERVYGWKADEVIGLDDVTLRQKDRVAFDDAKAAFLQDGAWNGELVHCTKEGNDVLVEARWTMLHDDSGQPTGVLVINTDVTDRRKLESEYARIQRMESIGTLAGGIAHDLNNVLTPILMAVELLQQEQSGARARELLDMIAQSVERGADMVRQILTFARGVDGRRVELDLRNVIDDVVRLITDSFPKDISIDWRRPQVLPAVAGDPTQLQQVLLNLCVNARDAMPGGGDLRIRALAVAIDEQYAAMSAEAEAGDYVLLEVTDSGAGIDPATITRIFEPFFTTKSAGHGTGLGLSVSRAIVKSHGGFIHVYSERDAGTTFKVYLPAQAAAEIASEVVKPSASRQSPESATVLVVEDERTVLAVTRATLEAAGYTIVVARDGADGVGAFASNADDVDIVLTDVMMPIMNGTAMVAALQRIRPDVVVIMVTGLEESAALAEARALGVTRFLTKPYTARVLLDAVADAASEARIRRVGGGR